MIPIKSYTNLNKIIKFYFEWLKINNQSYSSELLKSLKKDPTIIILSLTWLNKKLEKLFQSNQCIVIFPSGLVSRKNKRIFK